MTRKYKTIITLALSWAILGISLTSVHAQTQNTKNSSKVLEDLRKGTGTGTSLEKNIAILYHLNEADSKDINKEIYSRQLTNEIITNFPAIENIKLLGLQNEAGYLNKTEDEIITKLKVDGYLDLSFNFKKEKFISISPRFIFKDNLDQNVKNFDIPDYSVDYYKNFYFSTFVTNELSCFLHSLYNLNQGNIRAFIMNSVNLNDLLTLADSSSVKGDFYKSNYIIYRLIGQNPDMEASTTIKIYNMLGKNKLKEYRLDEAEEEFNKVLSLESNNLDANIGLATVKLDYNDYEGVLSQLESLPPSDQIYFLQGQANYGLGNYNKARELLDKEMSLNKEDQYAKLVILGAIYLELNETEKAIPIYRNLYRDYPTNEDIRYLYSYLLTIKGIQEYENKNFKGATESLLIAKRISNSRDVTDYLRLSYINDHRFQEALALVDKEIQSGVYSTNDAYLTHALDLREIFIDTTPVDEALGEEIIKVLNLHISYNPDDPFGYYYKGNTLTRLGKGLEGLAQMNTSFNLDTTNISTQLDLMELFLLNNEFEGCESFYYRVNAKNKSSKESNFTERDQAIMYYLLITSLRIQNKEYDDYLVKLNKLLAKKTDINRWDYESYRKWLKTCKFDEYTEDTKDTKDTYDFLTDLTKKMESHDETKKENLAEILK